MRALNWGVLVLFTVLTQNALGKDVAVCGASAGYSYFPSVGLLAAERNQWTEDGIKSGRITLSLSQSGDFDLLFTDATGSVISATQDGARVLRVGQTDGSITVIAVYPMLVEVYTFIQTSTGPQAIWSTNKHSTPIVKVAAYSAPCSFIDVPQQ
jgi:hypothetical protein